MSSAAADGGVMQLLPTKLALLHAAVMQVDLGRYLECQLHLCILAPSQPKAKS